MPRFFTGPVTGARHQITGPDAAHIAKSLRMRPGEPVTLCDGQGMDYYGHLAIVSPGCVEVEILEQRPSYSEPSIEVTLYQGIPKSDKMELIVQKSVELGISRVVPTMTSRCVSRPDPKTMEKKRARWQKIAEEAAKQSGRGRIPLIAGAQDFPTSLAKAKEQKQQILFLYEGGGVPLSQAVSPGNSRYALFVGPEGGFSPEESRLAQEYGQAVTLGPRILRTETAPLAALSALMFATGNMD